MESVDLKGGNFQITGRVIRILSLKEEWLDTVEDSDAIIREIRDSSVNADLFTFRQSVLETEPKYAYPMEWEEVAVIPISSHDHWLDKQISSSAKRAVKKASKKGVEVKVVDFSDDLVRGICAISNETPVRQGRRYPLYGKSFETARENLSREAARCDFIGAFLGNELIGWIQLGYGKGCAIPFGMVSKIAHRDKSPQNALLSKAVDVSARKGVPFILYGFWTEGGLGDFKVHNGCMKMALPRYYIPITTKGKVVVKLRLYRGLRGYVPEKLRRPLKQLRSRWHQKMNAE